MRKLYLIIALYTIFFGFSQNIEEKSEKKERITEILEKKPLTPKEQIEENIEKMQQDPVLKKANWGFVIYDTRTKKTVVSYNESKSFIPASTTKLLTTETAIGILGVKYRWTTQLEYSGKIDENGVLNGNLYIISSGDPSLGSGKAGSLPYSLLINNFKQEIIQKGIKRIIGDIVIQIAVFKDNIKDALPPNIVWLEHNNYYLPVGATIDISLQKEQLVTTRKLPFNDEKRYFYISPYTKKMAFTNDYTERPLKVKLPDAPMYLGNNLKSTLIISGVYVSGKVVARMLDNNPENRFFITNYKSPTVSEIIFDTNQRSDNALAEALLRVSAFHKEGNQTLETGKEVVIDYLKKEGFDMNGFIYSDGSGLSRSNLVTPISQVKFLTKLMSKSHYNEYFRSLPIGGQSGTLKNSFKGDGYGRIFAKTGTLNRVKCLAGYIKTRSGRVLAFSLLINNYEGSVQQVKSKMEQLVEPAVNL